MQNFASNFLTFLETLEKAILIREEKGNFIRIIPKPNDNEESKTEHNSILVNKNVIESIEYVTRAGAGGRVLSLEESDASTPSTEF